MKTSITSISSFHYIQNDIYNNYLEKDFQKFLYPLNVTRYIVYAPRYYISDNFITANDRKTISWSFCCALIYILIFVTTAILHKGLQYCKDITFILFAVLYLIIGSSFVCNFVVNPVQSDRHVDFVTTIQKILNSFKFTKIDYKPFIKANWVYIFFIYFSYICMIGTRIFKGNFTMVFYLYCVGHLLSDLNLVYMIRVIHLLTHITRVWTSELRHINDVVSDSDPCRGSAPDSYWRKAVTTYLDITEAARTYQGISKIPINFYMFVILFNILLHAQVVITYPKDFWSNIIITLVWILKHGTLLIIISFSTENFYTTLKNTQVTFLKLHTTPECSGELLTYKTVLRAGNAAYYERDSDVLVVDAALTLRFFSCVATYVVVLLQFKF